MIYLDANALIAAVVMVAEEQRTARIARLMRKRPVVRVSPLAEYEARKHLYQAREDDWEPNMETFLDGPAQRLSDEWSAPILQALKLARDFNERLAVDSADTLHVAWALSVGAETFASFDRRSGPRALALCVGLKLWPEATADDFSAMKRLKG